MSIPIPPRNIIVALMGVEPIRDRGLSPLAVPVYIIHKAIQTVKNSFFNVYSNFDIKILVDTSGLEPNPRGASAVF